MSAFRKLKLLPIFNMPMRPDRNAVEMSFSVLKAHYRKLRLRKIAAGESYSAQHLVKHCITKISKESIRNMCYRTLESWKRNDYWEQ